MAASPEDSAGAVPGLWHLGLDKPFCLAPFEDENNWEISKCPMKLTFKILTLLYKIRSQNIVWLQIN